MILRSLTVELSETQKLWFSLDVVGGGVVPIVTVISRLSVLSQELLGPVWVTKYVPVSRISVVFEVIIVVPLE